MENITLGQIGLAVAFLVSLLTGFAYLKTQLKATMKDLLKDQLDSIDKSLDDLKKRVDDVDLQSTKNFLVRYLSDVERGREIDEIERERFWEQYQHYTKTGGNSYIKHKVETMMQEGKL